MNSDASELLKMIGNCAPSTSIIGRNPLLVSLQNTVASENLTFYSSDVNAQYRIINLSGQAILQGKTGTKIDLNTSSLSAGLYLLQVQNSNEILTRKFIQQ